MKKIFLIIMFFAFVTQAQWVQVLQVINGMGNLTVWSLAHDGNNIFAGTFGYGVYRSTNNGLNWTQVGLNGRDVLSLTTNGNNIFAGTSLNGIYLSTNNGTNWVQTSINNQSIWGLAVHSNIIFAATESNGVYKSTNNGVNWIQTPLNTGYFRSFATNTNLIFTASPIDTTSAIIYSSSNNGINWTQNIFNSFIPSKLAANGNNVFAGNVYGVYISTNNGTNWMQTSLNNEYIYALTNSGNNIFAGTWATGSGYGMVYVSNNNGLNWSPRNEGLVTQIIRDLCIFNNYIFAGTNNFGVYRRSLSELIGITPISTEIPNQFSLSQNYPNPFNPKSKIKMQIAKLSTVKLVVYDMLGREVETLVNQQLNAGTYEVDWNAENFSSGIYYYKLIAGDYTETKKMVLMK